MTPEEIFAQLRDIHTPDIGGAESLGWDLRPILIFLALSALALILRPLIARLRARAALSRIDPGGPPGEQRDAIIALVGGGRGGRPPPEAAFLPPGDLTAKDAAALRDWAARRLS